MERTVDENLSLRLLRFIQGIIFYCLGWAVPSTYFA